MRLTVLVDNNTLINKYYIGEPAVSYYIEDEILRYYLTQDIQVSLQKMLKR